ncbi:MAG: hypothetical protein GY898_27825 [Proteobacteria bacterium]|nr:hypothetical protein [Pseudomonadota bacterium]
MHRSVPAFLLLSGLLLAGCVTLIEPGVAHVDWAQETWPGTSLQQLEDARELYKDKCTLCHPVRDPRRYEPDEWEWAIYRMLEGEDVIYAEGVIDTIVLYLAVASALPDSEAVEAYLAAHPELVPEAPEE